MGILSRFFGGFFDFLSFVLSAFSRADDRVQTNMWSENSIMLNTASMGPAVASPPMPDRAQQQIDSLQQIDPGFNQVAFLDYAAKAYALTLKTEGAMDPSGAQDVLTPDNLARLSKRIGDWKDGGFRRVVSDVKLDGVTLFKVSLDGITQSLSVRMAGSAVRYTQDMSSGSAADGSLQSESFIEFATFVRPAGSVTPKTAQLGGPTHCPSCGAPAPMSATKCQFCNTPLTPSGAPWLLDHVSQSAYT